MTDFEIESALQAAFEQCDIAACPLSTQQKQVLLQTMREQIDRRLLQSATSSEAANDGRELEPDVTVVENPLEQLTLEERQVFLEFVRNQESQNAPWRITLLNDWVQGRDSGPVQFIRDRYGIRWLERIKPSHLERYSNIDQGEILRLKVGDRIEVTNGLWEWVQETGPCSRQWFPCTVIRIQEPLEESSLEGNRNVSCIVRFEWGAEYEIQGVYDWNRPNWRWLQS